jgi:YVTN family beta-propeller protein
MKTKWFLTVCALTLAFAVEAADALKQIGTARLPDVNGRFDHFAFDPAGHRLFAAALGNDTVEVIDVVEKKRIATIRGLRKPTGVVFLPDKNQIGVAAGEDEAFKIFRGNDSQLVTSIDALDDADNVRITSAKDRIFVGYGSGGLAVVDAQTL